MAGTQQQTQQQHKHVRRWEVEKYERCRVGGNDNFSFIHSSGWKSVLEVGVALKWKINQICDAQ